MLVTRRHRELWLITHPEHGRVAGALCAQWGNDRFQKPAQHEALLLAATHHDDGWYEHGRCSHHRGGEQHHEPSDDRLVLKHFRGDLEQLQDPAV